MLIDPAIRRCDTQNVLDHALIFLRACDLPLIRSHPRGWIYLLSVIQGCQSLADLPVERNDLCTARLVMLFKKSERLAHDLAGRVPRSDLTGDELFKFRG